jgi:transcriptional regulator with XRE-family HTH domain
MSFRENLREALDFSGMEQKELAAFVGISLKTIENYLKQEFSMPSADKAVRIAQALGVSVEYLVTGGENYREKPHSLLNPLLLLFFVRLRTSGSQSNRGGRCLPPGLVVYFIGEDLQEYMVHQICPERSHRRW